MLSWLELQYADPMKNFYLKLSLYNSLRVEDARLCRQIHEMGFPLPRVVKGISAVGPDSQKLINFCLVVDR